MAEVWELLYLRGLSNRHFGALLAQLLGARPATVRLTHAVAGTRGGAGLTQVRPSVA
jgi:hypothetical protein